MCHSLVVVGAKGLLKRSNALSGFRCEMKQLRVGSCKTKEWLLLIPNNPQTAGALGLSLSNLGPDETNMFSGHNSASVCQKEARQKPKTSAQTTSRTSCLLLPISRNFFNYNFFEILKPGNLPKSLLVSCTEYTKCFTKIKSRKKRDC